MGIYAGVPLEPEVVKCHGACKPLFFPCGPCGLYSRDFRQPMAPSSCPSCRSVCVQRQQRQESRKRKVPAQGRAVPRRGTARKDFAEESCCPLKTLCHSNPSVCLVMLGISSIQMFPSQTCVHPGCGSCSEHLFSSETL